MNSNLTIMVNHVGKKLGKYHLISQLGENDFFTSYKAYYRGAYDYVVVNIVKNSLLETTDFADRFQDLPKKLVGLNHPSISKLYDCGFEDEIFYFVTEFIGGANLAREIESRWRKKQPFLLPEIIFIIQTIGDAIDHAHELNLSHGHIHLENILFTTEGIPVLIDFELPLLFDPVGLQRFFKNSRVPGLATTPASNFQYDIEALGWVLYQLVSGETVETLPVGDIFHWPASVRENFPPAILSSLEFIIHKATAASGDERFVRAGDVAAEIQTLILPGGAALDHILCTAQTSLVKQVAVDVDTVKRFMVKPGVCPYQGLFAFREDNAQLFFGRETFVDQLVNMVQQKSIVLVTGSSGSGKSSVVYAGLVPYLRQSQEWEIASMRPGFEPVRALAAAFSPLWVSQIPEAEHMVINSRLADDLVKGSLSILDLVAQVFEREPAHKQVLMVIDQFEELYTLCTDKARNRFLDMLLEATSAPIFQRKLCIVLTIRIDFLGQVISHRAFADRLYQSDIKLGPMNRTEIARAIVNPASQQGVVFEEGLVERILNDVGTEPGTLPLLQFALTQLWGLQRDGVLTHHAYDSINGVTGALALYADRIFDALDDSAQARARSIFMRLVRHSESTEDTRRLVHRAELEKTDWNLAQQLVNDRLMVSGRTPDGQETIEVVHEALIGRWRKLQEWIVVDRAFHLWQNRLWTAMRQWEISNKDEGALLRGILLTEAENWLLERQADLSKPEQNYVQLSVDLRNRNEAQALKAQQTRERNRLITIIGLATGFFIAVLLAIFSLSQWQHAREQQLVALSNQLAAQAISHVDGQEYDLAQLLSLESYRLVDSLESRGAVMVSLLHSPYRNILRNFQHPVLDTEFGSDSRLLVTLEEDGTLGLFDAKTGQLINHLTHSLSGKISTVALSFNDQLVATGDSDGKIIIWDITNQTDPKTLRNITQETDVSKLSFSPNGQILAAGGADGKIYLWNVATGQLIGMPLEGHTGDVRSLAFSSDGRWLASGSVNTRWASIDEVVMLWDLGQTVPQAYPLIGLKNNINDVVFSANGKIVAAASADGEIMLWDAATRQPIREPFYHLSGEQSASIAPPKIKIAINTEQQILASGDDKGRIILWDLGTGKPTKDPWPAREEAINDLEFSRDGHTLISANGDGVVILWASDLQLGEVLPRQDQRIWSLVFNPAALDNPELISGSDDGTIILWNIGNMRSVERYIKGHLNHVNSVAVSPSGKILASGSDDQTIRLWNMDTGVMIADPLIGHTDNVLDVTFSSNGQLLVSTSRDNTIILWDMTTLQPIGEPLTGHTDDVLEVVFSNDGQTLASAGWDGSIILWNVTTRQAIGEPIVGHQGAVVSLAASPKEPILASAGRDGNVILWDIATGQTIRTVFQGDTGSIWRVMFSPDGKMLASAGCLQFTVFGSCEQGVIRLWDVATGRQMGQSLTGHQDVIWAIAFSPDGNKLASGSRDGTIIIWDLDFSSWLKRACDIANRNLTEAEWKQYLGSEPYHPTCILDVK